MSKTFVRKMYKARSQGLHGADVSLFAHGSTTPQTEAVAQVARLERVLRDAVRRCLEDPDFHANFVDDASVQAWCPILEPDPEADAGGAEAPR